MLNDKGGTSDIRVSRDGWDHSRVDDARSSTEESDQAEVMALNQRLIAAYNGKDPSAIMALYSDDPNTIFFEDTIPLQVNKAALTKAKKLFKSVSDFHARMESVDVS
jgi:ketosteroid isomerase-like protein